MQDAVSYLIKVTTHLYIKLPSLAIFTCGIWADCSEMEQGELEVYWGQPFLVKSNLGYWDWPAGQKARLPHTQVQFYYFLGPVK